MKKVYGVKKGTGSYESILFVCDNYNDALHFAASLKEYDEDKAKEMVVPLPFATNEPIKFDANNAQMLIDLTIEAMLKSFEAVKESNQ